MDTTLPRLIGTLRDIFKINKLTIDASALTAARTLTVPDKAGTLAFVTAQTVGDGSNTVYTITHNLKTRDVVPHIYRTASPYDALLTNFSIDHTTIDTLTITFTTAPTTDEFRVVVLG